MNERNYGIDIFRILCCIGVLIYHTVDDVLGGGYICSVLWSEFLCSRIFFAVGVFDCKQGKLHYRIL